MKNDDTPKIDLGDVKLSPLMQKVLDDLAKVEVTFSVDEAEFKAKRIDGHAVFHLRDHSNKDH